MFHMDVSSLYVFQIFKAVIAVEALNMRYMGNKEVAHCGLPEIGYSRYSDQLISRGYKVARIEQTEKPSERDERNKSEKVKDKLVKRELCRITTPGTKTYGFLDMNDDEPGNFDSVESHYFMAIAEKIGEDGVSSYGVCFIDTSIGHFKLSQFSDDESRSFLRTLIAHNQVR